MRTPIAIATLVVGAAFVGFACSDDAGDDFRRGGKPVNNNVGDGGGGDGSGPFIPTGPGSGPPPVPSLQIRVAALDDGIGAFDFCVAPATAPDDGGPPVVGAFVGPVMEGLGVAAGLAPGNVSARSKYAPGSYLVRFVNGDSANCDAVGDPATNEIFIPKQPGETPTVTIARIPVLNAEEQRPLHVLRDEAMVAGQANVRIFHAATDPAGAIAINSPASPGSPIVPGANFGQLLTGSGFDENGYRLLSPLTGAQLTVDNLDAEQTVLTAENVTISAAVFTLFTAGNAGNGSFRLLVCNDDGAPANGLTPCMSFGMQ